MDEQLFELMLNVRQGRTLNEEEAKLLMNLTVFLAERSKYRARLITLMEEATHKKGYKLPKERRTDQDQQSTRDSNSPV